MLTRQQHDLLIFIANFTKENGWAPSYQEMATTMGFSSKSGVHRLVSALVERGFVTQRRERARSIEVIRMPGDTRTGPTPITEAAPAMLIMLRRIALAPHPSGGFAHEVRVDYATLQEMRALIAKAEGRMP